MFDLKHLFGATSILLLLLVGVSWSLYEPPSSSNDEPTVIHVGGRRLQLLKLYDYESGMHLGIPGQRKRLTLNAFNQTLALLVSENTDLNLHAYGLVEFSKYLIGTSADNGRYGMSLDEISFQSTVRSIIMHGNYGQRALVPVNVAHPGQGNFRTIAQNTKLYVNEANSTALLITRRPPTNFIEIYGLINDRMIITPVWRQLPKRFGSSHPNVQPNQTKSSDPVPHVIIDNVDPVSSYMGFEVDRLLKEIKVRQSLARRSTALISNVVYPEITIFIDYYTYKIHGGNVDEIWRYFVIYFSRIQLIFQQLTNPQIQLRLKNIFIANKPFPFQIMEPPIFTGNGSSSSSFSSSSSSSSDSKFNFKFAPHKQFHYNFINALKAINEFGFFFYSQQQTFSDSDLILVVTGQDLCTQSTRSSSSSSSGGPTNVVRDNEQSRPDFYKTCSHSTIRGQSFVGGACKRDDRTHKLINVAVAEDYGYFDGIRVAAHEIGHLLGSLHDGQWPVNGILGPGGRGCTSNSGYLMSNSANSSPLVRPSASVSRDKSTIKQIKWSVCSTEQLDHFIKLPRSVCLYNRPSIQ